MVTATWVGGQSLSADFSIAAAPVYPYPVVKWSSRTAGETLAHFALRQGIVIIDFENSAAQFQDFAQAAWATGGWGVLGNMIAGFINADLSMTPSSSTRGSVVNNLPLYAANSYYLFRIGRGASGIPAIPGYFTGKVTGTQQGHQYNGAQSYQTDHGIFGPFTIEGIVSKAGGVPPDETFAWGSYHDTNPTWTDFEIDGRDSTGKAVTAAGIGSSSIDNAGTYTYQGGYIHDLIGGAITHYNVTNTILNFTKMVFGKLGGAAINLERCGGSTVNAVDVTFGTSPIDIVADSDTGFVKINIVDPVLTPAHPKVIVCVHDRYNYPPPDVSPNKQINASTNNYVTLTVGGVVRNDLVKFVSSYTFAAVMFAIRHRQNPVKAFHASRRHRR